MPGNVTEDTSEGGDTIHGDEEQVATVDVDMLEVDTAMDHQNGYIDNKKKHDEYADESHKIDKDSDKTGDGKRNREDLGKYGKGSQRLRREVQFRGLRRIRDLYENFRK